MSGLFPKPKPIQMPVPQPAPEPPEVISEESKKIAKRKGRPETIITGELEPVTTKKTLLG